MAENPRFMGVLGGGWEMVPMVGTVGSDVVACIGGAAGRPLFGWGASDGRSAVD